MPTFSNNFKIFKLPNFLVKIICHDIKYMNNVKYFVTVLTVAANGVRETFNYGVHGSHSVYDLLGYVYFSSVIVYIIPFPSNLFLLSDKFCGFQTYQMW